MFVCISYISILGLNKFISPYLILNTWIVQNVYASANRYIGLTLTTNINKSFEKECVHKYPFRRKWPMKQTMCRHIYENRSSGLQICSLVQFTIMFYGGRHFDSLVTGHVTKIENNKFTVFASFITRKLNSLISLNESKALPPHYYINTHRNG